MLEAMQLYTYALSGFTVVDGDTVNVAVDLGFDVSYKTSVRLNGIDTPEKKGKTKAVGLAVGDWLKWLLETYGPVTLQSREWDKFGGRVVGNLYINAPGKPALCVSDLLLKLQMAQKFDGESAKQPWPAKALGVALTAAANRTINPWMV